MALWSAGPVVLCELQWSRTHSHLSVKQEWAFWKRWIKFHSCYSNAALLWTSGYHSIAAEILNLPSSPGVGPCFSFLSNIYLFFHPLRLKYFPSKSSILCKHKLSQKSRLPHNKPVQVALIYWANSNFASKKQWQGSGTCQRGHPGSEAEKNLPALSFTSFQGKFLFQALRTKRTQVLIGLGEGEENSGSK